MVARAAHSPCDALIDREPYRPTLADSGDSAPCGRGRRMRDVANGGEMPHRNRIVRGSGWPQMMAKVFAQLPRHPPGDMDAPTPTRLGGRPRCPVDLSRLASTTWIIVPSCRMTIPDLWHGAADAFSGRRRSTAYLVDIVEGCC
jgi:hypothetical protein